MSVEDLKKAHDAAHDLVDEAVCRLDELIDCLELITRADGVLGDHPHSIEDTAQPIGGALRSLLRAMRAHQKELSRVHDAEWKAVRALLKEQGVRDE